MSRRRFKYLFQLIYTSILLIIIPVLLFYNMVWKKSYEEINLINREYYNHSLSTFMVNFTDTIERFKNHVITFSVNSKSGNGEQGELSVFYYGTTRMKDYAYYYGEAVTKLKKYGQEIGYDNIGVYYYDEDVILTDDSKYTADRYLKDGLHIDEDDKNKFEAFFSVDEYFYNRIMLAPICDIEGKSEKILLGVCTLLGKEREKAILFCQIDYDDVEMSYISLSGKARENYYVVDNATQKILFSVGATQEEYLFLQKALADGLINSKDTVLEKTEQNYFVRNHVGMNLTFVTDTTGDVVQNRIIELYKSVRIFFFYIIFIMLFISAVIIYYNYRPMNSLLKEIKSEDKYEFEAILNAWNRQRDMLSEQRMMIMDLLMNQLLYGIPISQKYIRRLGLSDKITSYCVFVIENYVLKVSEMDEVMQSVEDSFGTLLFVTDIVGQKSTVLIALMEDDSSKELNVWLESWLKKHIEESYQLKTGHVVHEMNEIQKSFATCMEDNRVSKEIKRRAVISNKLKDEVLDYLEEHFADSEISQQQLADYFQISVYTLSKMFNNQIGIGFSEYLNSKRIEYAKELLSTTDIPVKNIAIMIGIPNDNYFSKTFKKYTGFSPIAYREEGMNKKNDKEP